MIKLKMKKWLLTTVTLFFMVATVQLNAQRKKSKTTPTTTGFELNSQALSMFNFRSIGPAAYSGRIADLAVNPDNPSEYYVGTASGGLWKTENHGTTFKNQFFRPTFKTAKF